MKRMPLIEIVLATILLLASVMFAPAFAWPEVDAMNMCNSPVKVVRAYKGVVKGWRNRDYYIATQKSRLYARNCPQVRATKSVIKKKFYHKVIRKNHRRKIRKIRKSCRSCYKKGYRNGYRAANQNRRHRLRNKKRKIHYGYRNHAEKVLDCKRVDWANYANRSRVIAHW